MFLLPTLSMRILFGQYLFHSLCTLFSILIFLILKVSFAILISVNAKRLVKKLNSIEIWDKIKKNKT